MVDVAAVPDRLEHRVTQAENQQVLGGFFSEIMIDPIDLMLLQNRGKFGIQFAGGGYIMSDRLFDDNATPATFLSRQSPLRQHLRDYRKEIGLHRKVK